MQLTQAHYCGVRQTRPKWRHIISKKWKNKLVSSSFPLEYEASKTLVKHDFIVSADYAYSRIDAGIDKDFSVDISANAYLPYSAKNNVKSSIQMLIECKQRNPSVSWLFLPDPNKDDFSPFILGHTVNKVDQFSKKFINENAMSNFELDFEHCYKGIEIDTGASSSRVYDAEIRHGLHQLQYALPRVLKDNIESNVYSHIDDNFPFFMTSILLTTSKLFVAKKDFSIKYVEKSNDIKDFSREVPYLITNLEFGPDFKNHCIKEFKSLSAITQSRKIKSTISDFRREGGEYSFMLPENLALNLHSGAYLHEYFSQIIVCNIDNFSDLIKKIKKVTSNASRNMKNQKNV